MKRLVVFIALITVAFSGCKPKDKGVPSNPCAGQEATSAAFQILEPVQACGCPLDSGSPFEKYFPTDTVLGVARFSALYNMDNYNWKIGQDTATWYTKSFDLNFSSSVTVNVSLIVKNKVSKSCFPNDKGADTTTKVLTDIDYPDGSRLYYPHLPIMGKYLGHDSSAPAVNYTISIVYDTAKEPMPLALYNFPNGCPAPWYENGLVYGAEAFRVNDGHSFPQDFSDIGKCKFQMYGWGVLQRDHKTLIIDYSYAKDTSANSQILQNRIHGKFIGTKIQ